MTEFELKMITLLTEIRDALQILPLKASPKSRAAKQEASERNSKFWETYKSAIIARYKWEPTRNARVNAQIAQITKRIPESEDQDFIRWFVAHNDNYYVRRLHAIDCALRDCETLSLGMRARLKITGQMARKTETISESLSAGESYLKKKRGEM